MKIKFLLAVILINLGSISNLQAQFGSANIKPIVKVSKPDKSNCLDPKDISAIKDDFNFKQDDDVTVKFDACDKENILNKVIQSLLILRDGEYEKTYSSDDDTFENSFAQISPYQFLKDRIKTIHFKDKCHSDNVLAYVTNKETKFTFCLQNNIAFNATTIEIAETAVHEARHVDNDDVGHVDCTQGNAMSMSGACDRSHEQHGSYFYSAEYSVLIYKFGKNFHPLQKKTMRYKALNYLLNRFNIVPKLKSEAYVYAKTNDNTLSIMTADLKLKPVKNNMTEPLFSRINGELLIYNEQSKEFSGWSYDSGPDKVIDNNFGTFATEYNTIPAAEKFNLLDYTVESVKNNSEISAILTDRTLKYSAKSDAERIKNTINLPFSEKPVRILKPKLCQGDIKNIYILTAGNMVYEGSLSDNTMSFKTKENCKTDIINFIDFNNKILGLSTDGQILELKNNSIQPVEQFNQVKFNFLGEPFIVYDFFKNNK